MCKKYEVYKCIKTFHPYIQIGWSKNNKNGMFHWQWRDRRIKFDEWTDLKTPDIEDSVGCLGVKGLLYMLFKREGVIYWEIKSIVLSKYVIFITLVKPGLMITVVGMVTIMLACERLLYHHVVCCYFNLHD